MNYPSVSVIIPAWGCYAGDYLSRAIDSALVASATPPEVLIVDNLSNPPVSIERAQVIRTETRLSLGKARNFGLRHAKTDYVLFLDADDILLPSSIDQMLACLLDHKVLHPRPRLVSSFLVNAEGEPYHWPYPWMRRAAQRPKIFQLLESFRPSFPVNGSLINRAAALRTLGYDSDPESAEDWSFGISLAWTCQVIPSTQPTMVYSPSSQGVWAQSNKFKKHLQHRRCVRLRIRQDRIIPRWTQLLIPLLAVFQTFDVIRKEVKQLVKSAVTTQI